MCNRGSHSYFTSSQSDKLGTEESSASEGDVSSASDTCSTRGSFEGSDVEDSCWKKLGLGSD